MVSNLKLALGDALAQEYAWIDRIDSAELNYQFSPEFEERMQRIIDELDRSERKYVHVGHRRIRRALLVAVVAVMLLGLVACAVVLTKPDIIWNETENNDSGTIDVTFDVTYEDDLKQNTAPTYVKPTKPFGYKVIKEELISEATMYNVTYENPFGKIIRYRQWGNIENIGLAQDIEAEFNEITVNGYKGYSWSENGNNAMKWSDGIYLYDIIGTCDMETIEKMARSIP